MNSNFHREICIFYQEICIFYQEFFIFISVFQKFYIIKFSWNVLIIGRIVFYNLFCYVIGTIRNHVIEFRSSFYEGSPAKFASNLKKMIFQMLTMLHAIFQEFSGYAEMLFETGLRFDFFEVFRKVFGIFL